MTRCGFDLSGEKTNFKPWIFVLIMKFTVISFHVGLSELDSVFFRGVSWASFCLCGPRATDSDVGASTMITCGKPAFTNCCFLVARTRHPQFTHSDFLHNHLQVCVSQIAGSSDSPSPNLQLSHCSGLKILCREDINKKQLISLEEAKLIYIMIPL